MDKITKVLTTKAEKREDRVLRFIGSSEDIDRDSDKILIEGWDIKNYKKNPVVLFGHDQRSPSVARTKKVWVDNIKKQLLFDIEFPEPEISSIGDSLYKLYKNGFMFATSVSFLPDFSKVSYPERKNGKGPSRIFGGQELTEISLVSVPANARALLTSKSIDEAISKDIVCKEEVDELLEVFGKNTEEVVIEKMDYEAEIKMLKEEIDKLKDKSYMYSMFDEYKGKSFADDIIEGIEADEKAEDEQYKEMADLIVDTDEILYNDIMKELE